MLPTYLPYYLVLFYLSIALQLSQLPCLFTMTHPKTMYKKSNAS